LLRKNVELVTLAGSTARLNVARIAVVALTFCVPLSGSNSPKVSGSVFGSSTESPTNQTGEPMSPSAKTWTFCVCGPTTGPNVQSISAVPSAPVARDFSSTR